MSPGNTMCAKKKLTRVAAGPGAAADPPARDVGRPLTCAVITTAGRASNNKARFAAYLGHRAGGVYCGRKAATDNFVADFKRPEWAMAVGLAWPSYLRNRPQKRMQAKRAGRDFVNPPFDGGFAQFRLFVGAAFSGQPANRLVDFTLQAERGLSMGSDGQRCQGQGHGTCRGRSRWTWRCRKTYQTAPVGMGVREPHFHGRGSRQKLDAG